MNIKNKSGFRNTLISIPLLTSFAYGATLPQVTGLNDDTSGFNITIGYRYSNYLKDIVNHTSVETLSQKVIDNITSTLPNKQKFRIISRLNQIENELEKIKTEIPLFLALQNNVTNNKDILQHQGILLKANRVINRKVNILKSLAQKRNILGLNEALDNAVKNKDLLDNSFEQKVKSFSASLKTEIKKKVKVTKPVVEEPVIIVEKPEVIEEPNDIKLSRKEALTLLRQASFTSTEKQIAHVMDIGATAWVLEQVNAVGAHDDLNDTYYGYMEATARLQNFDNVDYDNLDTTYPESLGVSHARSVFNNNILPKMIFTRDDQLKHRMAKAINEIVVTSATSALGIGIHYKSEALVKLYDDYYKHSLGNYRDILKRASMSPAMAHFLTFMGSKKVGGTNTTPPDENYARELMQLFSIGLVELNIDGTPKLDDNKMPKSTYSSEDVSQLSKVFTGWDWWSGSKKGEYGHWGTGYGKPNHYIHNVIHDNEFTAYYHDSEEKKILGYTIPAGLSGEEDIDAAIDILMKNDSMGPFISKHLIQKLVTSNPTPNYVARVARVFNSGLYNGVGTGKKGDLKATVQAILLDDEARGITTPKDFGRIDDSMQAFTHFASRLNAKGLKDNGNSFIYKWKGVKHLPMSAPTPFGHYTPEDAPADEYFTENNLVAPEMTLWTAKTLKHYQHGTGFRWTNGQYDEYGMVTLNGCSLRLRSATTWEELNDILNQSVGLRYDLKDIYDYFIEMRKEVTDEKDRIDNLYDFVAIKFFGEKLPAEYRNELTQNATFKTVTEEVREAIRRVITTSHFMIIE